MLQLISMKYDIGGLHKIYYSNFIYSAMMQCKTSFTRKLRWVVERESHKIARPQGRTPHKNVGVNRQIVLNMLHLTLSIIWDVLYWVYMILLAICSASVSGYLLPLYLHIITC